MSTMPNIVSAPPFTSADLLLMPEDGKRYEVIEGDLYAAKQPHWHHQFACGQLLRFLQIWSEESGLGVTNGAPGVSFAEDDEVAPDVVWVSYARLARALATANKRAREAGVDVEQSLISISQTTDGTVGWRINYGSRDYLSRRGGDLIIDVDAQGGGVKQVLRGQ